MALLPRRRLANHPTQPGHHATHPNGGMTLSRRQPRVIASADATVTSRRSCIVSMQDQTAWFRLGLAPIPMQADMGIVVSWNSGTALLVLTRHGR